MTERDREKLEQAQTLINAYLQGKRIQWRSYYEKADSAWRPVEHPKGLFRFLSDGDQLRVEPGTIVTKYKNEFEAFACPGGKQKNLTVVVLSEPKTGPRTSDITDDDLLFWVVSNADNKPVEHCTVQYRDLTGEHTQPMSRATAVAFAKALVAFHVDHCNNVTCSPTPRPTPRSAAEIAHFEAVCAGVKGETR